jgi:Cu(I)/Ag(I) efflux system membrane protein CusA/SilA
MVLTYRWRGSGFIALFRDGHRNYMLMTIYLDEAMNKMVADHRNSSGNDYGRILRQYY